MAGKDARGAVEEALARIERAGMQEIEGSAVRVPIHEALKQLIVAGNSLIYLPKEGGMKVFRIDRYVVKRDTMGNVMEIITKESVSPLMLPKEAQEMLSRSEDYNQTDTHTKSLDLYTYVCRKENKFEVHQRLWDLRFLQAEGTR